MPSIVTSYSNKLSNKSENESEYDALKVINNEMINASYLNERIGKKLESKKEVSIKKNKI